MGRRIAAIKDEAVLVKPVNAEINTKWLNALLRDIDKARLVAVTDGELSLIMEVVQVVKNSLTVTEKISEEVCDGKS